MGFTKCELMVKLYSLSTLTKVLPKTHLDGFSMSHPVFQKVYGESLIFNTELKHFFWGGGIKLVF